VTSPAAASSDATVQEITATPFRLTYASAVVLSDGVRETADQILVTVTTSDGVTGYGECIPRPGIYGETLETAVSIIEHYIAPRTLGTRITDIQLLAKKLGALKGNPSARSSVEVAVVDALARTLGVPAHRLLGGYADTVPCSAILAYAAPDAVVAEARSLRNADGVRIFKLKVGGDPARDGATAYALRTELGDDAVIYADANGRYTCQEAAQFLRLGLDAQLFGLEEPISGDALGGRRLLAQDPSALIIGDETCADPRAVIAEISAGRCTAVSVKPARTGIIASSRIREYCGALGAPLIIGTQADSAIGAYVAAAFAASSAFTATAPAEVLFHRAFEQNPVCELPKVSEGLMHLPECPGFGYEIDPSVMKECMIR